MSTVDSKKSKRRKYKKSSNIKPSLSPFSLQNENPCQNDSLTPNVDSETWKKIEKLMDAKDEGEIPHIPLHCGPNPFIEKEGCLLCGCPRPDLPEAENIKAELGDKKNSDISNMSQLPLWVCSACRKSADQEMEKKPSIDNFLDQDIQIDSSSLPFLPDVDLGSGSEQITTNGTVCTCEACSERRQIEADHERDTQELQHCWTALRKLVRLLYGRFEDGPLPETDWENDSTLIDEANAKTMVHRLCSRDPHQLFLRLESQVREFVIEMKVKLLKRLSVGYKTPPLAKQFICMLLDEYGYLCKVARKLGGIMSELEKEHLKKFNVTWELHNKHLFQSIAYTEPSIQSSLHVILTQLRLGAASKEAYHEDTYPNLLHRYLKFDDEMSVISVVWRDCQQLIEGYNGEQAAMKLKQKMLKEDWEFFKAQRKILEQSVNKNSKSTNTHSIEDQFTETMRLMLQGTRPTPEDCHCPRCNRKRCPCDECTITHMITCGIINPDVLEGTNSTNSINFPHDPNRYRIDVSPPSVSSTSSSSGSCSPIMVDAERLILPYDECVDSYENGEEMPEEFEDDSQSEEDDEDDEDDEEDDDDDEDEEDDDEEDDDAEMGENSRNKIIDVLVEDTVNGVDSTTEFLDQNLVSGIELPKPENCDCHHCVSQANVEQMMKLESNQCQCHICLQQRGKTVSTSLPQQAPPLVPQPGELHLYPHIHGSTGLQPNLYDLHLPIRQPKPIIQTKVPVKLDFDMPEGIHEHIYHAYGDWDNTYDPRILLQQAPKYNGGGLSTELLPPLTNNYSTNFVQDPFPVSSQLTSVAGSAPITFASNHMSGGMDSVRTSCNVTVSDSPVKTNKCTSQGSGTTIASPPCSRPAPLGENNNNNQRIKDKTHTVHCKKHNLSVLPKSPAINHSHINGTGSPGKITQEHGVNPVRNNHELVKERMQMIHQFANLSPNTNPHSCHHAGTMNNSSHTYPSSSVTDPHTGVCASSVSLPTTVNNVSVGTSTVCAEPDCDGHHEENYDSIDDSCSEQSSSTSNSNQKEGKYCDCCYCEFFGHGNPPTAPISKNYAEMRDKLRLRLKKKNAAKSDDHQNSLCERALMGRKNSDELDLSNLDELIKYINGTEEPMDQTSDKQLSSKATKRARQKQRKAEEKARIEIERECEKHQQRLLEQLQATEEKKSRRKLKQREEKNEFVDTNTVQQEDPNVRNGKKKKTKHKVSNKNDMICKDNERDIISEEKNVAEISNVLVAAKKTEHVKVSDLKRERNQNKIDGFSLDLKLPKAMKKSSLEANCESAKHSKAHGKEDLSSLQTTEKAMGLKLENKNLLKTNNSYSPVKNIAPHIPIQPNLQPNFKKAQACQQQRTITPQPQLSAKESQNSSQSKKKEVCTHSPTVLNGRIRRNDQLIEQMNSSDQQITTKKNRRQEDPTLTNGKHIINNTNQSSHPAKSNSINILTSSQNGVTQLQNNISRNARVSLPDNKIENNPSGNHKLQTKVKSKAEETAAQDQNKNKNKRNKKKNKSSEDLGFIDEVFMPRSESDLENGDIDEHEREVEEFKRFCLDSTPVQREKLQVNMNIKDIFKKKSGIGCS